MFTKLFPIAVGLPGMLLAGGFLQVDNSNYRACYEVGEEIEFRASGQLHGRPVQAEDLEYQVWGPRDQVSKLQYFKSGSPLQIRLRAREPGFVQVGVRWRQSKQNFVWAGAAIRPDKLPPPAPAPADFAQFWQTRFDRIRASNRQIERLEVPAGKLLYPEEISCQEIQIHSSCGLIATGFLAWPRRATKRSLPLVVSFNGASKVVADCATPQRYAHWGAVAFDLNFHGLSNQPNSAELQARRRQLLNYQYKLVTARPELYPMHDIFLRVIMSLDYLKSLPWWNQQQLIVRGGSLGGCQALVAAAFDRQVTLCIAGAAAMCNHGGTPAGWPNLLKKVPDAADIAPYFDAVNFAAQIKCPVIMTVGLIDRTCPPASSYTAYNALLTPNKQMHLVVKGDHAGNSPDNHGVYWYGLREIQQICRPYRIQK